MHRVQTISNFFTLQAIDILMQPAQAM